MAEKKKPAAKKKNPRFGGKRDLKDTSGNQKIGFEDTFLGDLLGFDGKMGTKGKPGLLASLKGARRKKPGQGAPKRPAAKKKKVPKADPGRQTNPIPIKKKVPKADPGRQTNPIPINTRRNEPGRNTNPIPVKPKAPTAAERKASQKRMMKRITLDAWKELTPKQREQRGLPKTAAAAMTVSGAGTRGSAMFNNSWKQPSGMNKGGMAKKK